MNEKGFYGMFSGMATTAALQPLENVKMALMIPPRQLHLSNNFVYNLRNASNYIYASDGISSFYKGIQAATIKAGAGCYIYFSILRHF